MSYAPILNPSTHTAKGDSWRQVSLAAAVILQSLADGDAHELKKSLSLLDSKNHPNKISDLEEWLANLPIAGIVENVTKIPRHEVLSQLVHQLREVKAFGELDGEELDDYIKPVIRLIKSGRIELFVG